MIHFFPTPYPEELWLSVLCRYHVRSGNIKFATTMEDLFGICGRWKVSAFFPTNGIHKIISQLPPGLLDIKTIILEHTLFLYYLRMTPTERKEKMLADFCNGEGEALTWVWSSEKAQDTVLRYCPLCCQEDIERFGEPYWHTNHQLPLISVCTKHKCRLESIPIKKRTALNFRFFLPSEFCIPHTPNYEVSPHEILLANTLDSYYRLPLNVGATSGYSNLSIGLSNAGYMDVFKRYYFTFNRDKIYKSLIELFDPKLVKKVFGEEVSNSAISKITDWSLLVPERYAMLSVMIGMSPEVMFGPRIPDVIENKIKELSKAERAKKKIAEKLGIKTYQLDSLCKRYEIEPFWEHRIKNNPEKRRKVIRIYFTQEEKEELEKLTQEKNFLSLSEMMRFCFNYTKKNL